MIESQIRKLVDGVTVQYVTAKEFEKGLDLGSENGVMAVVDYGRVLSRTSDQIITVSVPMPQLGPEPLLEVWHSEEQVDLGDHHSLRFGVAGDTLFGHIALGQEEGRPIEEVSQQGYETILGLLANYPDYHLTRMWNYLPDINQDECRVERYKRFCMGRSNGFEVTYHEEAHRHYPAATAVGLHQRNGLSIHFIAAKGIFRQVENPRQVSAYRYPPRYGVKSPSFARATLVGREYELRHLFIAGTASIVGSETVHISDLDAQFDETIRNIESLTRHALGEGPSTDPREEAIYKIYIRHPEHYHRVRELFEAWAGDVPALYLASDICRSDLLLEIEAVKSVSPV